MKYNIYTLNRTKQTHCHAMSSHKGPEKMENTRATTVLEGSVIELPLGECGRGCGGSNRLYWYQIVIVDRSKAGSRLLFSLHYENTPIQIY